jgi:hypothetical protein
MTKSACEMGIVAKATGVGDLAQGLACSQCRAAMQKARGMIQTKRIYEFAAGRAPRCKELLKVTQRDPRFGCHLSFDRGDPVFYRPLHLLERAHLDLAHALARDAELGGQLLQRERLISEATPPEDAPLTIALERKRLAKRFSAIVRFLALGEARL